MSIKIIEQPRGCGAKAYAHTAGNEPKYNNR
jgi:hypothetical protein